MAAVVRILLADDHASVRQAVRLLINNQPDMEVVAEAGDGLTAIQQAEALAPDVIVMDLSMPRMSGLVAVKTLKKRASSPAIVIWTRHDDDAHVREILRAGASSYVSKRSALEELLQGIRAAASGGQYLDSTITGRQLRAAQGPNPATPAKINQSESEVLRLAATGHGNKDIASRLEISVKTVEAHKANAFRKLGLADRVALMRYAVLQGWLDDM